MLSLTALQAGQSLIALEPNLVATVVGVNQMEDRKRRFDEADVRKKVEEVVKKLFANVALFDGVHVFTPHADVPDDSALRLVVLPQDQWYTKEDVRTANEAVLSYLRNQGNQPRHRSNRLLFVAADQAVQSRLREATRVALAWASIVDDAEGGRLTIDLNQQRQATAEARAASDVLPRAARECFRWLLCPFLDDPAAVVPSTEAFALNTGSGSVGGELERVCREAALIIETWSPIHLRNRLKDLYWKNGRTAVPVQAFWEDSLRYLYLPRLKDQGCLRKVVESGATSKDFFGTAYGEVAGKYDGFQFGEGVSFTESLLLIEPEVARRYADEQKRTPVDVNGAERDRKVDPVPTPTPTPGPNPPPQSRKLKTFVGTADVPAATARMRLLQIAEEVINLLTADPNAAVQVTIEISADFPQGASDTTRRAVSENATSLGFKRKEWE